MSSIASRYLDHLEQGSGIRTNPRNFSKMVASNNITEDDSSGPLKGRRKLAKKDSNENLNNMWFDNQRQSIQGYEYLCRVSEAKQWIERCIGEELPSEAELCNDGFRDGVILAKLTKKFVPELVRKIVPASKSGRLQFRHTENINNFFKFLDIIEFPDLFRFELTDLYEKKNIPKVIFCIHALSYLLANNGDAPEMNSLVGKMSFSDEDIQNTQRSLGGNKIPNFSSVKSGSQASKENEMQIPEDVGPNPREAEIAAREAEIAAREARIAAREKAAREKAERLARKKAEKEALAAKKAEELKIAAEEKEAARKARKAAKAAAKAQALEEAQRAAEEAARKAKEEEEAELKQLESVLEVIIRFQSIVRGSLFRYEMFIEKMLIKDNKDAITKLQSIVRAKKFRDSPEFQSLQLYGASTEIIELQSMMRGALTRKILRHSVRKIMKKNDHIVEIQSIIRGNLYRESLLDLLDQLDESSGQIARLQAIARTNMYKKNYSKNLRKALKVEGSLINLQAVMRGVLERKNLVIQLKKLEYSSSNVTKLQARIRTKLYLNNQKSVISDCAVFEDDIVEFQSKIRQVLYEKKHLKLYKKLNKFRYEIAELQSIARGGVSRSKLNSVLDSLDFTEGKLNNLVAIYKGKCFRHHYQDFQSLLKSQSEDIIKVQSVIRGLLSRFQQDMVLDDLDETEPGIIELQSIVRGNNLRHAHAEMMRYYTNFANVERVIKVQKLIKAKNLENSYKLLITSKNPPINVIAQFAHLLNDTDKDFEDEILLNQLNEKISAKYREIEAMEETNKNLDIKIALLVKNKITLDELIKQRNNGYSGYKISKSESPNGNTQLETSLNKSTSEKLEIYSKLFYLLQVEPTYLIKILNESSNTKEVTGCILSVFNSKNMSKRDEFFFIKFVNELIKDNLSHCNDLETFTANFIENPNAPWQRLFGNIIQREKGKMKKLFGPLINSISHIDDLSLESNPLKIYEEITDLSKRKNLTVEEAIQDPMVRDQFVKNLAQLRELSNKFIELISSSLSEMPKSVKAVMSCIYESLCQKFPDASNRMLYSVSGFVLIDLFIDKVLKQPEDFGIIINTLNSQMTLQFKKNLATVSRVLSQMMLMRPFTIEDVYFQPLNEFIEKGVNTVETFLKSLTSHHDLEKLYKYNKLNDIISLKKPTLEITVDELNRISKLINSKTELFNKDDELMSYIIQLIEINKTNSNLKLIFCSNLLKLSLQPAIKKDLSAGNSHINTLMIQAKRYVIFMLQVQKGKNLLDLLLKKITPLDEVKFQQIIENEKNTKNIYTSPNALEDLTNMKYHDLKLLALEKILELDSLGVISRENNFQELLNTIANDITNKKNQRSNKSQQIKNCQEVLKNLQSKQKKLHNLLQVYNDHINKSIASLQSKPKNKKKLIPFLDRQYFYQKQLKRLGKIPKFGSYKYGSKYLFDHGILYELQGFSVNSHSSSSLPRLDLMFSCDQVGVFLIEAANGVMPIPNAVTKLSLDDLLAHQYENKNYIEIFDGSVKFHTDTFLNFIFKKFYDNSNY